jgi:hypothetical protein
LRRDSGIGLPVRTSLAFMPRESLPEQTAHEGDAVAVVGIHVRLDLEDEAGHPGLVGLDLARLSPARAGSARNGRAHRSGRARHSRAARAEIDRRQMALAERLQVERLGGLAGQKDLVAPRSASAVAAGQIVESLIVGAGAGPGARRPSGCGGNVGRLMS